ncbi:MAG TPA: nitroreductase family deazaflavin-dependent oxidoreductase, partial [Ktedonobacteraceae bacterium]
MTEAEKYSSPDMNAWNRQIMEEFHANAGKVGGPFEGVPLLLLTTTGARSGRRRTLPVGYMPDGDRLIIFATRGGLPTNPDWYHNLVAHPEATVEVGTQTIDVTAVVITGEERDQLYARQVERAPVFAEYQAKTTRK